MVLLYSSQFKTGSVPAFVPGGHVTGLLYCSACFSFAPMFYGILATMALLLLISIGLLYLLRGRRLRFLALLPFIIAEYICFHLAFEDGYQMTIYFFYITLFPVHFLLVLPAGVFPAFNFEGKGRGLIVFELLVNTFYFFTPLLICGMSSFYRSYGC